MHDPRLCSLKWNDIGNLDYLVCILKERGYIWSKKELYRLFNNPGVDDMVRWKGDKLEYLALLLYRLYNEKYFIIKRGKGYLSYAEWYFTDFAGKKMKRKTLKYLSSEVNTNKIRYAYVHKEIDEIIKAISKA